MAIKKEVKILSNQNLVDISLQETGTVEAAFDICLLNDFGLTDDREPGEVVNVDVEFKDNEVVLFYKRNMVKPVTGGLGTIDAAYAVEVYVAENYWV